jgi:hypothetical protein
MAMDYYFVYCGKSSIEREVISELQPERLLMSHHYFKNKDLAEVKAELGYEPTIFYDSGAFSAHNSGSPVDLDAYIQDIKSKEQHIEKYMCLDTLGDNHETFSMYARMIKEGLQPVPVFQYEPDLDLYYLDQYAERGEKFVALGGTVPIRNRNEVREWVKLLCWTYPEINFHLLGAASKNIIDHCDLKSADASSWILQAAFGKPRHIPGRSREAKKQRAKYLMQELLNIPS